jgi:AmiR/NasT family two-component response regulator
VVTEPALPDSAEDRPIDLPETRAVIEQAKGILMATYRCGPDEALDLLRRASQAGGLKVHMLAAKVVDLAKRGLTIADAGHRGT